MKKAIISTLFILSSCVSFKPPQTYQYENARAFSAPLDKVWSAMIATLSEKNVPIKNLEKSSGLLTTDRWISPDWVNGTSIDADCGVMTPPGLGSFRVRLYVTFNVFVRAIDSAHATAQVNAVYGGIFDQVDAFGGIHEGQAVKECNSKGALEKRILDAIQSKL
jgi:hypothetical protein